MLRENLRVGTTYKIYGVKTGNTFVLFCDYHPGSECFRRQDGQLHFGREFIEFENGECVLDIEEA